VNGPAITVATNVFNGERYLAQTIESVLGQTFGDFEYLLLDDGSQDGSLEIIQRYAAKDSRIRVIARENRGLVASLNEQLGLARGPLLARLDADDICRPDRLALQKAFLDANPDHGAVGSDTSYIDEHGAPSPVPPVVRPYDHAGIIANFEDGPNLCHPAVTFRTATLRQVRGYRSAFEYAEDLDLWMRLSEVTLLANLPETLLAYRVTSSQVSSRHLVKQTSLAAIAWLAHCERLAGRADPTAALPIMPAIDQLDDLFGLGAARYVRRRVIDRVLYSADALSGDGWPILLAHAAENTGEPRLWRAAARLLRAGQPAKAGRVAATLMGLAA
jgi:glycosyltransferase involved in cell wall biosynthesis